MGDYHTKTPDELFLSLQQELIFLEPEMEEKLIKNLEDSWDNGISMNQYRNKGNKEFSRIKWLLARLIQSIFTRNKNLEKFKLNELHEFVNINYKPSFDLLYKNLSEEVKLYQFSRYKGFASDKKVQDNMAQKY